MEAKNQSANKQIAQSKANEQILSYMDKIQSELKNFDKSEYKTSKGQKQNVYKDSLFKNCLSLQEKRNLREEFRKDFNKTCISIIQRDEDKSLKNSLIAKFLQSIKDYFINDNIFELKTENYCNSNMSDTSKNSITKAIQIVQKSEFYKSLQK